MYAPFSFSTGKLHSLRANQDGGGGGAVAAEDPDDKWDWMTGIPTSLRFLAKSWKNVPRGPGGILLADNEAQADKADFSGTINMLALLAKVR